MANRKCSVAFTIESLKDESVWLNISDIGDADAECVNENIVIFRGRLAQLMNRLLKCRKGSIGAHQSVHDDGLLLACDNSGIRLVINNAQGVLHYVVVIAHNVKSPYVEIRPITD